jgi:hypothetical protein
VATSIIRDFVYNKRSFKQGSTTMIRIRLLFLAGLAAVAVFVTADLARGDVNVTDPQATPIASTSPDVSPTPSDTPVPPATSTPTLISSETPYHYRQQIVAAPEVVATPQPSDTPSPDPDVPNQSVSVVTLQPDTKLYCTYDQGNGYTVTVPVEVSYSSNTVCPATEPK